MAIINFPASGVNYSELGATEHRTIVSSRLSDANRFSAELIVHYHNNSIDPRLNDNLLPRTMARSAAEIAVHNLARERTTKDLLAGAETLEGRKALEEQLKTTIAAVLKDFSLATDAVELRSIKTDRP
jgi:hypothetical protein